MKEQAKKIDDAYWRAITNVPDIYTKGRVRFAAALIEAVEGLNIEPDPDRELSIEKHHFIKGQNWVKDAILRLADELEDDEL